MKKILLICAVLCAALSLSAQTYIVESPYRDAAKAYKKMPKQTMLDFMFSFMEKSEDGDEIMIPNGTEVTLCSSGYEYAKVSYEGEQYNMAVRNLRFSPKNPAKTADPIAHGALLGPNLKVRVDESQESQSILTMDRDSSLAKFYCGLTMPIIIFVLAVVLMVLMSLADNHGQLHFNMLAKIMIVLAPVLLTLLSVLELLYIVRMGWQATWWCQLENFEGWTVIFGWLLFCIALIAQARAFHIYENLECDWHNALTSKWGLALSGIFTIVALVAAIAIYYIVLGKSDPTSFDELRAALQLIGLMALGLSLVFPLLYYSIKYRSLAGVIVGPVMWFNTVAFAIVGGMFVAATWAIIRIVVLPLIGIAVVMWGLGEFGKFKTVKTGTEIVRDSDGNIIGQRDITTMEYDKNKRSVFDDVVDGLIKDK